MTRKSLRGWGLEVALSILRYRVACTFMPLAWNNPLLVRSSFGDYHLVAGPFHVWTMYSADLLGITLNVDYDPFWYDHPKCPPTAVQLFPLVK